MQFIYQALTWGFLLALLPLLIHLINMMRHQRVKWAAMEFLLQSYKKHRKWVWLKQLLLLLARVAVILLIVAMLAQLKTRDQWLDIFGGQTTHHYILLDDSYSMSDRLAGASALDAGRQVVSSIVQRAASEDSSQLLTLIRFSQARGDLRQAEEAADFNSEPIDASFDLELERKIRTFEPTQLAVGPGATLGLLKELLGQAKDETSIVYLLSDFRAKDWATPTELRESLQELKRYKADLHFVNCARSQEPNLGIVDIAPTEDTRAAGVPLFVNVRVKNFGQRAATKVQLKLQAVFYPPGDVSQTEPDQLQGVPEELATLLIDSIGPGETVVRRVQVYFPQAGKHVVEASLPEDPVEADNRRWCVIEFPDGERTLVIDGSVDALHAYYMEAAFRPLEKSNTGVRPDIQPVSFLRDATDETLSSYATIYLLDVPRLENRAVEALEAYVRSGGGLAIFAGPNNNLEFYNQALYRNTQGLLPLPLEGDSELPPIVEENTPDVELTKHPIFSFFLSETNPLIRGVKVDRFRRVAESWQADPNAPVDIIATLRDKSPLLAEKKFGQGQVILCLTTLAPEWNDWAKNPSFVVVLLKMQSYLASTRRLDDPRLVGTPLAVQLEADKYRGEVAFVAPGQKPGSRIKIDRQAIAPPDSAKDTAAVLVADIRRGMTSGSQIGGTDMAGIYEAWPLTTKGDVDLRRWAFNVEPLEGDLTPLASQELLASLAPVKVNYHLADQYQQEEVTSSGYNLSFIMLGLLVALLVGEQFLAYSASYHPAAPRGGATSGGAR